MSKVASSLYSSSYGLMISAIENTHTIDIEKEELNLKLEDRIQGVYDSILNGTCHIFTLSQTKDIKFRYSEQLKTAAWKFLENEIDHCVELNETSLRLHPLTDKLDKLGVRLLNNSEIAVKYEKKRIKLCCESEDTIWDTLQLQDAIYIFDDTNTLSKDIENAKVSDELKKNVLLFSEFITRCRQSEPLTLESVGDITKRNNIPDKTKDYIAGVILEKLGNDLNESNSFGELVQVARFLQNEDILSLEDFEQFEALTKMMLADIEGQEQIPENYYELDEYGNMNVYLQYVLDDYMCSQKN